MIVRDCVREQKCVRWPDFIVPLWYLRFGNHNLITPSVSSLSFSVSPSTSVTISREITVLRQFLGVPSDAHIVGQRFHCHQVGALSVCTCIISLHCSVVRVCVCLYKPVTFCRYFYAENVTHCQHLPSPWWWWWVTGVKKSVRMLRLIMWASAWCVWRDVMDKWCYGVNFLMLKHYLWLAEPADRFFVCSLVSGKS